MCLSGSCLTVAEDTHVIAIKSTLHELTDFLEDFVVLRRWTKHTIKGVRVGGCNVLASCALLAWAENCHFFAVGIIVRERDLRWVTFRVMGWPHATHDSDVALEFLNLVEKLSAQCLLLTKFVVCSFSSLNGILHSL